MVDFGHPWAEGECSATPCRFCRFKNELRELVRDASDKPEHVWHKVVGGLSDRLFDAVWALHRVRRSGFTDDHDMIANEHEAAQRLVDVFKVLDEFRVEFGIPASDQEDSEWEGDE
jgi:hypothetical protein